MKNACDGLGLLPLHVLPGSKRIYIDNYVEPTSVENESGLLGHVLWYPKVTLLHCLFHMKLKSAPMWNERVGTVMWPNLYVNCGGIQGLWEIVCLCVDTRDNVGICRECQCFIYRGLHSGFRNICAFLFNYPGGKKEINIWWTGASEERFSVCAGEMLLYHWGNKHILSNLAIIFSQEVTQILLSNQAIYKFSIRK